MTRYIKSTESDCKRMAAGAIRRNRIAKGHDPDVSPDGKPYTTLYSGRLIEGRDAEDKPTGNYVWVPQRSADVLPADESKEVQERDLGDEFKVLRTTQATPSR